MGAPIDNAPACLILAAGEIADYGALAGSLPPGVFVLCADGGLRHCAALGLVPDLLIGDLDSLGGQIPQGLEVLRLPPDKNYTDATHAVEEAVRRGFRRLILAGMTGSRADHSLANVQNLVWCAQRGLDALLTDGRNEIRALCGENVCCTLHERPGHYFSLLAFSEVCEKVTILGGKYPLDNYDLLQTRPRAVSNEFTGRNVQITMRRGALLVLTTPIDRPAQIQQG